MSGALNLVPFSPFDCGARFKDLHLIVRHIELHRDPRSKSLGHAEDLLMEELAFPFLSGEANGRRASQASLCFQERKETCRRC